MEYADILHRCFRCGYCKLPGNYVDLNCPAYLKYRFETFSPGGRLWLLRAWLNGEIQTSVRLAEILFTCATCANCVQNCAFPKFKDDLLNAITAGREALVSEGAVPPSVRDYFKAVHTHGNPYKLPPEEGEKWAAGLDIEPYSGQEYLFYVGDVGLYDQRGQKMARAAAGLLKKWGVSFGILGSRELCDGNEVRALGEKGLFEQMARQNIRLLKDQGVRKIITLSPHTYHVLRNDYASMGGAFEVSHYSQHLQDLARQMNPEPKEHPLRVTFHDPCYLGRHNGEYKAPRKVLRALRGLQVIEMDRSRENALCCGGGGGNFFTDCLGPGADHPARARIREAADTGAEVMAVACPSCARMLEDAVKAEELETRLRVMDLAELVLAP